MNKTVFDFHWCLHCERTYKKGTGRIIYDDEIGANVEFCHYEGCDGTMLKSMGVGDMLEWEAVRTPHEGDPSREVYPEIPEYGKRYPLYSST